MRNLTIVFVFFFIACVACKSTTKLYEEGQYDRAVYSALDDLRKKPDNATAAGILPQAYNEAVNKYENSISSARAGTPGIQKLDLVYKDYKALQKMYDAIAATPAAFSHVSARNYSSELNQSAEDAAEFLYSRGMNLLQRGDRISAQKAYESFKNADRYVRGYKDIDDRKAEAYDLAIVNVVVDKFDQRFGSYNVNGNYFQNDIVFTLNNIGNSHYYKFYATAEPRAREVRIDQYMDINVYDISFGQLYSNDYSYTVSKEVAEMDDKDPKITRTSTVTANVFVKRRVIDSRAVMDYRITDAASRRMLGNDRLVAQFTWEKLTGRYTGDSRALGDKDWAVVHGEFNNQPDYNELYKELTNQLMNQFNNRMRGMYGH